MIMFQNLPCSQYQVYDESILELGYPPVKVLKDILSGTKNQTGMIDYYTVNGTHTELGYSYNVDLADIKEVFRRATELAKKKRYLYYFGGIIMCDARGTIQREVSSCYRLIAGKKLTSVTDEEISIPSKVLRFCQISPLPDIRAGDILQYFSDHCKTIVRDEAMIQELGFVRINSSTFAASQQKATGDLIFVVQLMRGRSLLLLTMKHDDITGLLKFRQR